jgi:hypothetical protein
MNDLLVDAVEKLLAADSVAGEGQLQQQQDAKGRVGGKEEGEEDDDDDDDSKGQFSGLVGKAEKAITTTKTKAETL